MSILIPTREGLQRFFARGQKDWVEAFARLAPVLCPFYEMDRLRWVHFAGQIAAETDYLSLTPMRENMNFTSTSRIIEVYDYRLRLALKKDPSLSSRYGSVVKLAGALRGNPEMLADVVYGGREGTPWMRGHLYIGRGPTQITHLDNYREIGREIARQPGGAGMDLVAVPELLEQPEWGVRSAFADWHIKSLSRWADRDDCERVSACLNTGSPDKIGIVNGMARRKRATAHAKGVWPEGLPEIVAPGGDTVAAVKSRLATPSEPNSAAQADVLREGVSDPPETENGPVRALQARLRELGYALGDVDGTFGVYTKRAVVAFQAEHGLLVDGEVGARTADALKTSAPLPPRPVTAEVLAARGSTQISLWGKVRSLGRAIFGTSVVFGSAEAGGLEVAESVVSAGSRIKALFGSATDIVGWALRPSVLLAALVALVALGLLMLAKRGIADRVESARSGANLSK